MHSKLTDEELIALALEDSDTYSDVFDVRYYTQTNNIVDGKDKIYLTHIYEHYKEWSIDPIALSLFSDTLEVKRKTQHAIFIDKKTCTIDLDKYLGMYVKRQKECSKKERLRQISSNQSKAKRQD